MENYNIFVDLAADIDSEIIDKYNIKFIPMNYSIDDKEYVSDSYLKESDMKHFYDEMRNGKITKTSQITPFKYVEFLEEYAKNGENVLYIVLSSGLSNTHNSALLAKQELEESYPGFKMMVVDSLGATGGIGVLAQIAAINREKGMSLEENFKYMDEIRHKLRHWFFVDDLKYLKRGGRVSSSKALIAATLNIKPIMCTSEEGKLIAIGKKIGTKRAAMAVVEKYFETRDPNYNFLYISHGDDIESANIIKRLILEEDNTVTIHISQICPVIGCHSGPGTVALCHIAK